MKTATKNIKSKTTPTYQGLAFRSMIAYILSYFRYIRRIHSVDNGLDPNEHFRLFRTKSSLCDTHIFEGSKYTIEIIVRQNKPEKGGENG